MAIFAKQSAPSLNAFLLKLKDYLIDLGINANDNSTINFSYLLLYACYLNRIFENSVQEAEIYSIGRSLFKQISTYTACPTSTKEPLIMGIDSVYILEHLKKYLLLDTDIDSVFGQLDRNNTYELLQIENIKQIQFCISRGLYVLSRTRKFDSPTNYNDIFPIELLIYIVDSIDAIIDGGQLPNMDFTNTSISTLVVFLIRISEVKIYPVVIKEIITQIASHIEYSCKEKPDTLEDIYLVVDFLYAYFLLGDNNCYRLIFDPIDCVVRRIQNIEDIHALLFNTPISIKQLRLIQQLSRLNNTSKERPFDFFLSPLIDYLVSLDMGALRNICEEIEDMVGMGLFVLSYKYTETATWDEILLIR